MVGDVEGSGVHAHEDVAVLERHPQRDRPAVLLEAQKELPLSP
jgi:hypothetical protein